MIDVKKLREEGASWDEIEEMFKNECDLVDETEEEAKKAAEVKEAANENAIKEARKDMCDAIIIYLEALGHEGIAESRDMLEDMFIEGEDLLKNIKVVKNDKGGVKVSGMSRFGFPGFGLGWF